MTILYAVCLDFDEVTDTCLEQGWAEASPLGLPALEVEAGAVIGAAFFALFAVCYAFKRAIRTKDYT